MDEDASGKTRREFLQQASAAGVAGTVSAMVPPGLRAAVHVAGSDAPEKQTVRVGFIPLTDCASVVIASVMQFDRRHGIRIVPVREPSWAAARDRLVSGENDASHFLHGMVCGMQTGIGGPARDMSVLMTLSRNGQAITLANDLAAAGVRDGESLARHLRSGVPAPTLAHTFPTGTHAMWLHYWLAAHGIDPRSEVSMLTVPPPQMVDALRLGHVQGFCAGEPWNARALFDQAGFTVATSQDVWPDHPEKVLAAPRAFARDNPNTARAIVKAVLEASRYIDTPGNRRHVAEILAHPDFIGGPVEVIDERLEGRYANGLGRRWQDPHPVAFHDEGAVNFPYWSDAMWFMTQHRRWGLLDADPDYAGLSCALNEVALYREAAGALGIALPDSPLRTSRLVDGATWNGLDPVAYAGAFAVHA